MLRYLSGGHANLGSESGPGLKGDAEGLQNESHAETMDEAGLRKTVDYLVVAVVDDSHRGVGGVFHLEELLREMDVVPERDVVERLN